MVKIMNIDQALAGTINALREGADATDGIVILVNRETNEFKIGGFPYDPARQIEVLEKALGRMKRAAARDGRIKKDLGFIH